MAQTSLGLKPKGHASGTLRGVGTTISTVLQSAVERGYLVGNAAHRAGQMILLFMTPPGTPLSSKNLYNRELAPARERIKEPRVSWHAFRHTHATLLTDVGESIKTAQAQLGHPDLATTLNLYTHVVPDSQRRAVERISEALFSIVLKLDDGAKNGRIN